MEQVSRIWKDPVWSKVISNGIIDFLGLWPTIYSWFLNILSYLTLPILVPLWLLAFLIMLLLGASVLVCRLFYIPQPVNKSLYNSLSSNEKNILKELAKSDFGQTEGKVYDLVSITPQHFLLLIDRLVDNYQLVERTVQTNGGAFWSLSKKGRALAAEEKLYDSETSKTKSNKGRQVDA
jgi:hypothetical protein